MASNSFSTHKAQVRDNLDDARIIGYSTQELNEAMQDAYDEVVSLSQCIVKKVTLPFQNNLNYYNFQDLTNWPILFVSDYMATTAIFSNQTHLWLLDDKVIKDFDRERIDWENWTGNAIWWCPVNDSKRIALVPKNIVASNTFDLYYWAQAPLVVDSDVPLIPADFQYLIDLYATALLLESYEEFTKANNYWEPFWGISTNNENNLDKGIYGLAARTKNISKSDLLLYA